MKYELTPDLVSGNTMVDSQHRQLFDAVNKLMDACSAGKGRDQVKSTADFLNNYVAKHFQCEEQLQLEKHYPGYPAHKQFHDGYRRQLTQTVQTLVQEGPSIKGLNDLNKVVAILVSHIRTEDRRMVRHIHGD